MVIHWPDFSKKYINSGGNLRNYIVFSFLPWTVTWYMYVRFLPFEITCVGYAHASSFKTYLLLSACFHDFFRRRAAPSVLRWKVNFVFAIFPVTSTSYIPTRSIQGMPSLTNSVSRHSGLHDQSISHNIDLGALWLVYRNELQSCRVAAACLTF
jgi:hypothetical protein